MISDDDDDEHGNTSSEEEETSDEEMIQIEEETPQRAHGGIDYGDTPLKGSTPGYPPIQFYETSPTGEVVLKKTTNWPLFPTPDYTPQTGKGKGGRKKNKDKWFDFIPVFDVDQPWSQVI